MSARSLVHRWWTGLLGVAGFALILAWVGPRIHRQLRWSPDELTVVNVTNLEWDSTSGRAKSGRADPQLELNFPWWARPFSSITLELEPVDGAVGLMQLYYTGYGPGEEYFLFEKRVDLRIALYGGREVLKMDLPVKAHRVRIDPPDGAHFIVHRVTIDAWPGQNPVVVEILYAVAGVFALLALGLGTQRYWLGWWQHRGDCPRWLAWGLLAGLLVLRLWLTMSQPLKAVGGSIHDDQHFIDQAASLLAGEWLGTYDHLTLIKGQGYPLWIAAMHLLGLPLVASQHLLYAGAVGLIYLAWRPAFSRWACLGLVALVLFNPTSFHGDDSARVLRNHFCASLALLTFVSATGWFLRVKTPSRVQGRWAAATGLGYTALWLSREEAVWMSGVLALIALGAIWTLRGSPWPVWRRTLAWIALPVATWAVLVTTVCALNYRYYEYWGTVEFRHPAYRDAYGALSRITVGPWRQFVPVSREAREAAYAASPTFSKIKPYLEGDLGFGWAYMAESTTHLPPSERQIHGAGFMWALRDGAAASGEHLQSKRAMAFYRSLADEVNAACDRGDIPALGRRSGFVPPWRSEYTEQLPGQYWEAWKFISTFAWVVPRPPPSTGVDVDVAKFQWVTRSRLQPRLEDPPLPESFKRAEAFRNGVLKDITAVYSRAAPYAVVVGLGLWVWLWSRVWRGRAEFRGAVLATVALAGACAITLVVTLVHVTSFVAITIGYLSAAYPLMLAFIGLTVAGLLTPVRGDAER